MVGGEVAQGEESCTAVSAEEAAPASGPLPTKTSRVPQQEEGSTKTYQTGQCWQSEEVEHLKKNCPTLKGKGLPQDGNSWTVHKP